MLKKEVLVYQKNKDDLYEKEQRDSQKSIIRGAESVVNEINKQFAYAIIKAPMDGIIVKKISMSVKFYRLEVPRSQSSEKMK